MLFKKYSSLLQLFLFHIFNTEITLVKWCFRGSEEAILFKSYLSITCNHIIKCLNPHFHCYVVSAGHSFTVCFHYWFAFLQVLARFSWLVRHGQCFISAGLFLWLVETFCSLVWKNFLTVLVGLSS